MLETYHCTVKKGSCYGLSLHRKHVYNEKIRLGRHNRTVYLIIPFIIYLSLIKGDFLNFAKAHTEEEGLGNCKLDNFIFRPFS